MCKSKLKNIENQNNAPNEQHAFCLYRFASLQWITSSQSHNIHNYAKSVNLTKPINATQLLQEVLNLPIRLKSPKPQQMQ